MRTYPFEKAFSIEYTYLEIRTPHADAPSIYLFSDLPSKAVAQTGTGALQTVSSWLDSTAKAFTKVISLSAVSDPDTEGQQDETYYLAVNYKLQSGGTTITDIKPIVFSRTVGKTETHGVDIRQIKKVYPAISEYLTDPEIDDQIQTALAEIKDSFRKKGFKYDNLAFTDELYLALAFKTLQNALFIEASDPGDIKLLKSKYFEDKYIDAMDGLRLPQVESNGQVSDIVNTNRSFRIVDR